MIIKITQAKNRPFLISTKDLKPGETFNPGREGKALATLLYDNLPASTLDHVFQTLSHYHQIGKELNIENDQSFKEGLQLIKELELK